MSDFDQEAYLEGLDAERVRVEGEGDADRVKQIDAEIKKYRSAPKGRESTAKKPAEKR